MTGRTRLGDRYDTREYHRAHQRCADPGSLVHAPEARLSPSPGVVVPDPPPPLPASRGSPRPEYHASVPVPSLCTPPGLIKCQVGYLGRYIPGDKEWRRLSDARAGLHGAQHTTQLARNNPPVVTTTRFQFPTLEFQTVVSEMPESRFYTDGCWSGVKEDRK